jgi:hypothetical protein
MMEDFHDSPQCVGKALEAAALVEAEARTASLGAVTPQAPTGAGGGTSGSATPQAATGGGPTRRAQRLHGQPPKGGCPVGLRCSHSDNTPRAGGRKTRSPSTRPPHVPDPPQEGCTEGASSGEEEGAPGPPTIDETRSYLDFYLDTCCRGRP